MARVSVSRAACGRRCGRAFFALKKLSLCGTRHQTNEHLNDYGRHRPRVSQLSQLQTVRVGQKTPMKSTVSQLSHLSQSKNPDPEPGDPPETLQNLPDGWCWEGWGTPPFWFLLGLFQVRVIAAPRKN